MTANTSYRNILVAIDYSTYARAALKQAVWLARSCNAKLTLIHAAPDETRWIHANPVLDVLHDRVRDEFEVRENSGNRMRQMIADESAGDLDVNFTTQIGEPFVEIIHAVQKEGYDLVLAGTRGLANWEQFFVGSTAKRLIRKCPASVWIVHAENAGPPKVVLAATDFSEVSRKAVLEGLWIADRTGADFHLLHVIDSGDVPPDVISRIPHGSSLEQEIQEESQRRLDKFVESWETTHIRIQSHLIFGTPWKEIQRLAQQLSVDLIAIGTVGRSGIKGLLLGNTAEKVLDHCDCSLFTVKPDGFVSPIPPLT